MTRSSSEPAEPLWPTLVAVVVATLVVQLLALALGRSDPGQSLAAIALPSLVYLTTVTVPLAAAGLSLGARIGLGAPLAFGLAHLPQLISIGAGSPIAIGGTVVGNSAVGILYGWCFWRRGLVAAIIAHLAVDVVLHVLPAIF